MLGHMPRHQIVLTYSRKVRESDAFRALIGQLQAAQFSQSISEFSETTSRAFNLPRPPRMIAWRQGIPTFLTFVPLAVP